MVGNNLSDIDQEREPRDARSSIHYLIRPERAFQPSGSGDTLGEEDLDSSFPGVQQSRPLSWSRDDAICGVMAERS